MNKDIIVTKDVGEGVGEKLKLSKYKGNIPAKIINFFYITKQ